MHDTTRQAGRLRAGVPAYLLRGSSDISDTSPVRFTDLPLSPAMLSALRSAGYEVPTPVQSHLIPLALAGKDVVAQAKTGTGKTAAFAIPILEQISDQPTATPKALVLAPTRELAVQVTGEVVKLSRGRPLQCTAVYGGAPIRRQLTALAAGPHIVIGTPGRILDHMGRGSLDTRGVSFVVLDEADRMLDIGFRPDIEKILRRCPRGRQTLLVSATIPPAVQRLAQRYMIEPESINLSPDQVAVETIEQHYFTVAHEQKYDLLVRLLQREQPQQAIIFCRTKRGADRIYRRLSKEFSAIGCMHGDMDQSQRNRTMQSFRNQNIRFLVATDVMGRGIDVTTISHIINYDIPEDSDDYVHRVGRTGRMGREGVAFTFVEPEQGEELTRIEKRIDRMLVRDQMEGTAPVQREPAAAVARAVPDLSKRGPRQRRRRRAL